MMNKNHVFACLLVGTVYQLRHEIINKVNN